MEDTWKPAGGGGPSKAEAITKQQKLVKCVDDCGWVGASLRVVEDFSDA